MKAREFKIYHGCSSVEGGNVTEQFIIAREVLPDDQSEVERLKKELIHYETNALHSCHAECERAMCVMSRENESLKAQVSMLVEALRKIQSGLTTQQYKVEFYTKAEANDALKQLDYMRAGVKK